MNHPRTEVIMKIDRRQWMQTSSAAVVVAVAGSRSVVTAAWESRALRHEATEVRPVVTGLAFDRPTGRLASAGDDHLVRIWDLEQGTAVAKLAGHRDWVRSVVLIGDSVCSGGNDRTVRVWNLSGGDREGRVVWRGESPIVRMTVSADGKWLGLCCFAGDAHWFSVEDWQHRGEIESRGTDLRCAAFSHDSQTLATSGRDGVLRWVDLVTGRQQQVASGHRRRRDLLFLEARRVIAGGDDGLACLIDLDRPNRCRDLRCETGRIFAMARIDHERIATAGSDNTIRIWNVVRQRKESELAGHTGTVSAICWTGTELVSAGYDTTIRIWRPAEPVARRDRHDQPSPGRRR